MVAKRRKPALTNPRKADEIVTDVVKESGANVAASGSQTITLGARKSNENQLKWITKKSRASNVQIGDSEAEKAPEPSLANKFSLLDGIPEIEEDEEQ